MKNKKKNTKKRRNACRFLSLDVLLKFVRHLSPPFPSLMIPAEPLWGMASVVRLAFTFPRHQVFWDTESGDSEAHHSRSSSGYSSLSSPIGFTPSFSLFFFFLLLYFCIRRHSLSHSSFLSFFFFFPPSVFLFLFCDLRRMISSVEKKKEYMHRRE